MCKYYFFVISILMWGSECSISIFGAYRAMNIIRIEKIRLFYISFDTKASLFNNADFDASLFNILVK